MANTTRVSRVKCATGNATKAEYNAGKVIIPPRSGKGMIIVGGWFRSVGNTSECDHIQLVGTDAGATVYVGVHRAQLANGVLAPFNASTTDLTTYGTAIGTGVGVSILSDGTDESTATSVDYCVYYTSAAI